MPNYGFGSFTPPAKILTPDDPPSNPSPWDDEFEGNQLNPQWTTVGSTPLTITVANSLLNFSRLSSVNTRISGIEKPVTGPAWKFRTHIYVESTTSNYNGFGMCVKNSANGRYVMFALMHHGSFGYLAPYLQADSDANTYAGEQGYGAWEITNNYYLEMELTGAIINMKVSNSGFNFFTTFSYANSSYLLADPTHIGLCVHHWGAPMSCSFDWIRRVG